MNQSLDGYVDHTSFAPGPALFRHFIEQAQGQAGSVYGRRMYEVMRYWNDDHPEWDADERAFAAAWRKQPKWVVSRSLTSVGPNARLVEGDLERAMRELRAAVDGELEVAGPGLARSLTDLGLIDEYRIYLHPVVLGHGKPYFAGPRPRLRLVAADRIDADVVRLTYVPAGPAAVRLPPAYSCRFQSTLCRVPGQGGWVFAPVPEEHAPTGAMAWGRTPVHATVDGASWDTSVWREKSGRTLLAIPKRVRG